jgi:two-component system response regulator GlrR
VIVATKKDLEEEVKKGTFREDLFYRIHVIPILLPPLKERKEDIPHLVDHLLKKICEQMKKNVRGLSPQAMQKLMLHDWPGNVRELENALEYAVAMTQEDVIGEDFILQTNAAPTNGAQDFALQTEMMPARSPLKSLKEARAEFERAYLVRLLGLCEGKVTKAAEIAGKYRADFYDLLKKHNIKLHDFKRAD